MQFSKIKKHSGYTLVEIIVVLVILAVLAAILIPTMTGYIDKAKEKSSIADARLCVVAAQTLMTENYAQNKVVVPEYADIISLAEVKGSIQADSVEADGATLKHLVYAINDYSVTYCQDTSNCSRHAETYTVTKGAVASANDSFKALFNKYPEYGNTRLDSLSIENSGSKVAKLFNSLDPGIQNFLKDKTWYIGPASAADPETGSYVRIFFTEKAYSAAENATKVVVYKVKLKGDGSVSYQKGTCNIKAGKISDANKFEAEWHDDFSELG